LIILASLSCLMISLFFFWITGTPQYSMFRILLSAGKDAVSDSFFMQDCTSSVILCPKCTCPEDSDYSLYGKVPEGYSYLMGTLQREIYQLSYSEKCDAVLSEDIDYDEYVLKHVLTPKNQARYLFKMISPKKVDPNDVVYAIYFTCEKHNEIDATCSLFGYENYSYYSFKLKKYRHVYMLDSIEILVIKHLCPGN